MYAIVEIAGHQYKVEKDQQLYVNRLEEAEGKKVDFDKVLLVDNDGKVKVGAPAIEGAMVTAKVVTHLKGDKVIVFKKKRRKGYKVRNGHRQYLSQILIEKIAESGAKKAVAKKADAPSKEAVTEKATAFLAPGSALLFYPDLKQFDIRTISFGLLILIATNCYALSVNTISKYLNDISAVHIASLALLFASPIPIFHLLGNLELTMGHISEGKSFTAIVVLAIFGTALAIIFFNQLVKKTSPVFASTVTYLIPFVALFWGHFDGEPIHLIQVAGLVVVLGGILLTRLAKRK